YNVEYQPELARAAALLREAAALTTEATLKAFLTKRAAAFLSNDYYESDVAWMEVKGAIEPTIGPYEVYEDEWFNYKAAFEAFFTHIVVHELMHGLGPHNITVGGRATTVRQQLKEMYSFLEEAKADVSALFAIQHMIDKGVLPKSFEQPLYTTYLASAFRSIR